MERSARERTTSLAGSTSSEFADGGYLLVVPLGSTEQHGPHLPLDTDTRIAVALADSVAAHRPDLVVAPPVAFGASGEHAGFPGTLSIGTEAMASVITELVRSTGPEFVGVVLVNGHGGNSSAVKQATDLCNYEGRPTLAWSPRVRGGDAHAGRTETSLMLAIAPEAVRLERAEAGDERPITDMLDELRSGGVLAVSPNGVLGNPAGASPAEGTELLASLTTDLAAAVAARFGDVGAPLGIRQSRDAKSQRTPS